MEGIQMEPIGKYKADRNGSAKAAAWRNMVDQDLDDVAFLADTEKAREARDLREAPVAVCSQRRALCLLVLVFAAMFATALLVVYATPQADCPCGGDNSLIPGLQPTEADSTAAANKERISTSGAVFPWRGARLPPFVIPKHYSLWLHPNLTTGELRGEVSIDFKVDRDTNYVVLNVRDMNVTERALFKTGGTMGPKIVKFLDYPQADQTYYEFKEKLRRKYNYTLSLRFVTKLERNDKQRGFFLTGNNKHKCAISRFWLTNARSTFPCLDEPHFRATFRLTIVRDRFHVSLTNMPIVSTEEAGFYLGHRLLQDEFAESSPMPPYMVSITVCRLQRRAAPLLITEDNQPKALTLPSTSTTELPEGSTSEPENVVLPPPEISLYSDQQIILDESGPLLDWVQKTIEQFAFELNTSYPLPKFDIIVVDSESQFSEGWGIIVLSPSILSDTKIIAKLIAQQWFGGLVSPRWWNSQWLMEALTSVLGEKAPSLGNTTAERPQDALLLDHILPALRLDSSNTVRAVASPRLERADIEAATDELSLHKGAAIVSMAIEAAGETSGRAALARLLRDHRAASADARDLWRALQRDELETGGGYAHAWDGWCEKAGYPLLVARTNGSDVVLTQERFVMAAEHPDPSQPTVNLLFNLDLIIQVEKLFYEPHPTEPIDINATTTAAPTTTAKPTPKPTKPPPPPKWIIPVTFQVGPLEREYELVENVSVKLRTNGSENNGNSTWYTLGNDTASHRGSRWAENVTHLIWMNDTDMKIPELGKHQWVRYNVGARGLYRVTLENRMRWEQVQDTIERATALYANASPAERALLLDDAFVLARARRMDASKALAASTQLTAEKHWAPWRVAFIHLSWWKELLHLTASGPYLMDFLKTLHGNVTLYSSKDIQTLGLTEDQIWLSGALLSAGVEWRNPVVTKQALDLFDQWNAGKITLPEAYQEAAFTAGVQTRGRTAWLACWKALNASYSSYKPLYEHRALVAALSAAPDQWDYYRFAFTVLSAEAQEGREWKLWVTTLCSAACRWRGAEGIWRILRSPDIQLPPSALHAAARCLFQPYDYYTFKQQFGDVRGGQAALETIALNSAFVASADPDLLRYFRGVNAMKNNSH